MSHLDDLKSELEAERASLADIAAELQQVMRVLGPARSSAKSLRERITRECISGGVRYNCEHKIRYIDRWRAPRAPELVDYDYWCRYNFVHHSEELRMERILKMEQRFASSKIERLKKQIEQAMKKKKKVKNDGQFTLF